MEIASTPSDKRFRPGIFALFFCGIAGLFILIGSGIALSQAGDLRRLVRVEATVVRPAATTAPESGVEAGDIAEVRLRYRSGGAERLVPAPVEDVSFGPHGIERHPGLRDGMTVPVWVDPAAPEAPRLSPAPDFFPYLFILFPMLHLTIGIAVALFAGQGPIPLAGRARRVALLVLVWNGVGGLCLAHYRSLGGAFDLPAGGAFAAYGAIGLGLVIAWWLTSRAAALAQPTLDGQGPPPTTVEEPPAVLPDR